MTWQHRLREQILGAPIADKVLRTLLLNLADDAWWAASLIAEASVALGKREAEP